jgi:DNA polymerase I-like protein with 3'-5' exonuclease and polymerase domains
VHDEIVVECDEGDAKKVEAWLKRAMVDGMDGVLNAPVVEGPLVPIDVEVESARTWAG